MNNQYHISGKSTTLKRYASVQDTIEAVKRIISENYKSIYDLSASLAGFSDEQTFNNIWNYVRQNIKYKNDEKGKEQLRTPQRTLHDKIGDCDDMSILISAILTNLDYEHELIVAAYKNKNKWQHIYPVAYDSKGTRYTIDCVPEIPYFNYEAQPIKNQIIINMRLEELGQSIEADMISELRKPFDIDNLAGIVTEDDDILSIQGLLGNVLLVDEDEEYDTMLSGSELKSNIILKQLLDAKTALQAEISNPTELSQLNDNRTELELVNNIIENFDDEEFRNEAIIQAINKDTLYQNFYKTIAYGMDDAVNGLSGEDDDMYYLKLMQEEGLLEDELDEEIEGFDDLGRSRSRSRRKMSFRDRIKKKLKKFKEKHPKLAKIGHALKKFSPHTFALRKSMELFLRGNVFHMAEKLSIGYATESQAKKIGYNRSEWKEFVKGKDKAEKKWYALGGKKSYFKKMISNSRGAKKAGLKGELGVAPAVIAAVGKVFGVVIKFFKKMKLKKKDGSIKKETSTPENPITVPNPVKTNNYTSKSSQIIETMDTEDAKVEVDEKSGIVTEIITDESGKETKVYKDKEGNEINKFKAFYLKNKTILIIISIILVVGIIALIIWKARQAALNGLGGEGLSRKQENFIKRQGLNNRAYASLVREEIQKDGKKNNKTNRKYYYGKVFKETFAKPLSEKQTSAALSHNSTLKEVRELAKENGGGSKGWKTAWAIVKKKR